MGTQLKLDPIVMRVLHDDHLGHTIAAPSAGWNGVEGLLNTVDRDEPRFVGGIPAVEAAPAQTSLDVAFGDSVTEQ
ncbi:MAG: hypothetical protein HKN80_05140 [Acidimicrobiia bacterium]|nr:hypothetical protein [Acidimicrobiia bacterium]